MKQLALELAARPTPTLDRFVVGRNVELVARLRAFAGDDRERFVYLWGGPASGRTHLLRAVVAQAHAAGRPARYLAGATAASIDALDGTALACIDDVDRLDAAAAHALFVLYERLREAGGALLAAGAQAPARLPVRPELLTRLAWGLVYEVHALSDEEKAAAMAEHAHALGFALPDDVGRYLLRHAPRDLAALLECVERLERATLERHRPANVALARELLAERDAERPPAAPSPS